MAPEHIDPADHPATIDVSDWSVEDLERVCAERGLKTAGKPDTLAKRIVADVEAKATAVIEPEPEPDEDAETEDADEDPAGGENAGDGSETVES